MKEIRFVQGRLKSVTYAVKGFWLLITTEHSIMVHSFISTILIVLGFLNHLTATEWMFQIIAIGLLLIAEALNTAIEKIANFIEPNHSSKIGEIKDIGAGAVLIGFFTELAIVLIIYIPKFS